MSLPSRREQEKKEGEKTHDPKPSKSPAHNVPATLLKHGDITLALHINATNAGAFIWFVS